MAASPNPRRNSLTLDLMGSRMSLSGLSHFLHSSSSSASFAGTPPARTTPMDGRSSEWESIHGNSSSRRRQRDETVEEEKRQDIDCVASSDSDEDGLSLRSSPRSPIAVLKLRRTRLFPDEDDKQPTKPFTVTYSPVDERDNKMPSHSLASSMFLVSPLRPLAGSRRRAPSADVWAGKNLNDFKASLIDSSKAVLRPLTPPHPTARTHRPKRSMSDMHLPVEESKEEAEYDNELHMSHMPQSTFSQQQRRRRQQPPQPQQQQQQLTVVEAKPTKPRWLIPAEHPYKVLWDVLTFMLSFANVYATHTFIRDRQFGNSWFMTFCEAWFIVDILLNFITEYRSDSYALRDCRSVWARYLTTWFVVDVLSLFPGEALYLKPLIETQNRGGFFKKTFFRSKAVVRVTRILRGRHFKMFGQAAKHTKHAGVGASRLLHLLIKYIPKYIMFFRNMKGVLAVRMLRQVHWFRKVWRNFIYKGLENEKPETTQERDDQAMSLRKNRPVYDEDEDGAPF